jgi:hypothetical protein
MLSQDHATHGPGVGGRSIIPFQEQLIGQEQLIDQEQLIGMEQLIGQEQLICQEQLIGQEQLIVLEQLIDQDQLIDLEHTAETSGARSGQSQARLKHGPSSVKTGKSSFKARAKLGKNLG